MTAIRGGVLTMMFIFRGVDVLQVFAITRSVRLNDRYDNGMMGLIE